MHLYSVVYCFAVHLILVIAHNVPLLQGRSLEQEREERINGFESFLTFAFLFIGVFYMATDMSVKLKFFKMLRRRGRKRSQ